MRNAEWAKFKREWAIAFLAADIIYLEIVLRLNTGQAVFSPGLAGGLFTALSLALLLGAISCSMKGNKSVWISSVVFAALLTVWFLFCALTFDAYKVYMPPNMIISQAGNAAKDFGGNVLSTVVKSLPVIILFFLPVLAVLLILGFKKSPAEEKKPAHLKVKHTPHFIFALLLAVVCIFIFFAGRWLSTCTKSLEYQYYNGYTYDSAVRNYGAVSALVQSFENSVNQSADKNLFSDTPASEVSSAEKAEDPPEAEPTLPDMTTPAPATPSAAPQKEPSVTAQPTDSPSPQEYGYNIMDLDFSAVSTSDVKINSLNEYIQTVQPTKKNQYTGLFQGKNLILITAEAFSKEVIDPERTPTLYRMATKGIVFEDYYQPSWGGSTSTGEFSFLTGLIPMDAMIMMSSRNNNLKFTMGNQLDGLEYNSFAYHNGTHTYYSRNLTLPNMGYSQFMGIGSGIEKGLTGGLFPESDREMIDYTVPMYIDKQPFSVYYMTISGHASYGFKDTLNDMCVKNRAVTESLPYSEPVNAYLACNMELEYAMESLIRQLEEAGIADDTVIALTSDHYPYGLLPSNAWGGQQGLLEELYGFPDDTCRNRDHNAAIIWCGELEDQEPIVVSKPVYSVDLLPTLSNLFALEYDSGLMAGRDALSDCEGLVIWNDGCWLSEKGYFDSHDDSFTPKDALSVDEAYIEETQKLVADRLSLSRIIQKQNYYAYFFGE